MKVSGKKAAKSGSRYGKQRVAGYSTVRNSDGTRANKPPKRAASTRGSSGAYNRGYNRSVAKGMGAEGPKQSKPRKPAMTASQRQKLIKKINRVASKFDRPVKRGR